MNYFTALKFILGRTALTEFKELPWIACIRVRSQGLRDPVFGKALRKKVRITSFTNTPLISLSFTAAVIPKVDSHDEAYNSRKI